ncbi:protein cholesin [Myripristis murdjan]|uniref:Chromosome 24 C7orf50 homolog n=1 Tax=Myripristis murdjan TaxID=586833 RepID=A0A667YI95_9TELE|nr:uncharacterized protein C7orf50 homolog [Myripristis murdjan]XP_029933942.1 uncharacterized protein C7orf50 homolog [Myripristis murdjan]
MAKSKPLVSEPKGSGPKRKKLNSNEEEVKKKRKKSQVEEAPLQIPDISIKKQKKHINDKEMDDKHKKKKKKKQIEIIEPTADLALTHEQQEEEEEEGEEDLSPEEQRALERKMKKILKKEEKKRVKAEGKSSETSEESKPTAPQQALDYLSCWAEKRKEWKFQKTRQTWLLQHMFDSDKIPDENFSVLLQYLEGLRGGARDTTVQKATALVKELEQEPGDRTSQQRAQRAREVIQLLT